VFADARDRRLLHRTSCRSATSSPATASPIEKLQDVIMSAIGGENITTTIEGRERYRESALPRSCGTI